MSHALYDQLADADSEADAALGGDDGAQHIPAAVCRGGTRLAREGSRAAGRALPTSRGDAGRSRGGHAGVHELPDGALEEDLVEQPPGEVEQGDKAAYGRGGHLPEPIGDATASWRGARRAERLVDSRKTIPDAGFSNLQRGPAGGAAHTADCGLIEQRG